GPHEEPGGIRHERREKRGRRVARGKEESGEERRQRRVDVEVVPLENGPEGRGEDDPPFFADVAWSQGAGYSGRHWSLPFSCQISLERAESGSGRRRESGPATLPLLRSRGMLAGRTDRWRVTLLSSPCLDQFRRAGDTSGSASKAAKDANRSTPDVPRRTRPLRRTTFPLSSIRSFAWRKSLVTY